jgi:NADH:ubiquinone oxidoreductase subunit 4 (subunit M)
VDISLTEKLSLGISVVLIFLLGVYPQLIMNITTDFSEFILKAVKGSGGSVTAH